ncbi:hypothetical protein WJX74_005471 [Apatococcus lobatus]|uniref:DRBM domain-containing protein n=1 Tax=Apatococcus lobatus TaxID=904363 RepID=A0AAW1SES9_9CHLO
MNPALGGKTAKSVLNELYQKHPHMIRAPTYETKQDSDLPGTTFTCQVDLPAIPGAFAGGKFKGNARSKKVAEQTAAESALRYVHEKAEWVLLGQTSFGLSTIGHSPNRTASESQLKQVMEELRLGTKNLQQLQVASTTTSSETSSEEQLAAEMEAVDRDGLDKPALMKKLAELEQENRMFRLALSKEHDLRKQVAALLTSQPTTFASAMRPS